MRTEKGLDSIVVPFYRLHILALTRVYHPRKFSSSLSDSPCTFVASSHPSNLPLFLVSPVIPTRKAHAGRTSTFITTSNLLPEKCTSYQCRIRATTLHLTTILSFLVNFLYRPVIVIWASIRSNDAISSFCVDGPV